MPATSAAKKNGSPAIPITDPPSDSPTEEDSPEREPVLPVGDSSATPSAAAEVDRDKLEFWDLLAAITEPEWEKDFDLYLYRIEPRVRNAGRYNYIEIYNQPINFMRIKTDHGGGKYRLLLKNLAAGRMERELYFTVEGEPRFITGQKVLDAPASPPAAAATADNAALAIVSETMRSLTEEMRQIRNSGGNDAAAQSVELVTSAYRKALEATAGGKTSPEMSAILETLKKLSDSIDGGRRRDKSQLSELADTIALIDQIRGTQQTQASTGELGALREILGADNMTKLVTDRLFGDNDRGGKKDTTSIIMDAIQGVASKLPEIIAQFSAMQQASFERAMIAHNARQAAQAAGQLQMPTVTQHLEGGGVQVIPPQVNIPVPANVVTMPPPMAQQEKVINDLLFQIRRSYENGRSGDVTAQGIIDSYPEIVQQMKGMLGDLDQVKRFATSTPILSEITTDEDWPLFVQDFVHEILQIDKPDDDNENPPAS